MSHQPYLSKSLFIRGLQCHKSLWLHRRRPELKDKVSESQQAVFDAGTDVGILAQRLYPGGAEVPYEGLSPAEQVAMTKDLIQKGSTTIYEAAFSHDQIFCKADILHLGAGGWELYEVKNSTGPKEVYLNDIALQYRVICGSGLPIAKASLVHINNRYLRQGEIDVTGLFTILDITEEAITRQPEVAGKIGAMRDALAGDMPVIDIGPHCSDPYGCDFTGHCWAHIPENSVFDFSGPGKPNPYTLYREGILRMEDVPVESLKWRQKMQLEGLLTGKNQIKVTEVRDFLDSLWYPLCFLDFETLFMAPVPLYDGQRPYQQLTFQFSLHLINHPGAELCHSEYLADGTKNPQPGFLDALLAVIPEGACVLAWNQVFEVGRLRELAAALAYRSSEVHALMDNVRDLMVPFRKRDLYHWKFNGSYSIKAVLPALVPELCHKDLAISNGEMASNGWLQMVRSADPEEKDRLRRELLEYCHLDTLAMVRIWERMHQIVDNGGVF
jgi:hypothetical protein